MSFKINDKHSSMEPAFCSSIDLPIALTEQLRELYSKSHGEFSNEMINLIKGKDSQVLKDAFLKISSELKDDSDVRLIDAFLIYLFEYRKYLINIDDLILSIENQENLSSHHLYPRLCEVLTKFKESPPFLVAPYELGPAERGDMQFCKNLENSFETSQILKSASDLQIRSALIYFSSKKSSFHQSIEFEKLMISIIETAIERKIHLDCTDGFSTPLVSVCGCIPDDSCTEGQKNVIKALLKTHINPFDRMLSPPAPLLIFTMNLEILKLFLSHPASALENHKRTGFLEYIEKDHSHLKIYQWLHDEKENEAKNFWK